MSYIASRCLMCFYVRSLCLLWHELHALCSSSCCDVEYNVIITFLHTHTKKKIEEILIFFSCFPFRSLFFVTVFIPVRTFRSKMTNTTTIITFQWKHTFILSGFSYEKAISSFSYESSLQYKFVLNFTCASSLSSWMP
jgi:hypothetical protein